MLSWMLKRRSGGALERALMGAALAVTLAAMMLALVPAVAEAQTEAQTEDKSNSSVVVVRPGDSLWSISEEQLGSNAPPQRIVNAAEQIYALNRERIGADPNLIFVGQELLVPQAMQSERPTGETAAAHKKTAETAEAVGASSRDRAAKSTTSKAQRTTPSRADANGGEASETVAQRETQREPESVILPDVATAAPVPDVRTVASNDAQPLSSVTSFLRTIRTEVASAASALADSFFGVSADARAEGRWLLGVGVLVLTLVVAGLMAWRLPMRRTTREDAERWGASSGYHGETPAASPLIPFAPYPGSLGETSGDRDGRHARRGGEPSSSSAPGPVGRATLTRSAGYSATSVAASVVRKADTGDQRGRTSKAKSGPRNGLALGAHNPKVRRAPQRVHASMRARKLRPRRRASRQPLPPGQTKEVNTRGDGGR